MGCITKPLQEGRGIAFKCVSSARASPEIYDGQTQGEEVHWYLPLIRSAWMAFDDHLQATLFYQTLRCKPKRSIGTRIPESEACECNVFHSKGILLAQCSYVTPES